MKQVQNGDIVVVKTKSFFRKPKYISGICHVSDSGCFFLFLTKNGLRVHTERSIKTIFGYSDLRIFRYEYSFNKSVFVSLAIRFFDECPNKMKSEVALLTYKHVLNVSFSQLKSLENLWNNKLTSFRFIK
jgi:hypothetical protein